MYFVKYYCDTVQFLIYISIRIYVRFFCALLPRLHVLLRASEFQVPALGFDFN